jgi:hypothetical protein
MAKAVSRLTRKIKYFKEKDPLKDIPAQKFESQVEIQKL